MKTTPGQIDLRRMRKFYETDRGELKLSTLLRELPWAANRLAETAAALGKENQGESPHDR
jgi:hypothetical protein